MANEILYGQSIDMDDLQILNFVVHSSASAPINVDTLGGMMWWKSDSYDLRVYNDDDATWNSLVQGPTASLNGYIPRWSGIGGNKLVNGLSFVNTTLGDPGSATSIVSEAVIRAAITSITISTLGGIPDVTITDITNNEMLVWESDHWENQTAAENNLARFDGSSVAGRVPYWTNTQGLLNDGYLITADLNVDTGNTYLPRADAITNGFPTNFIRFQGGITPSESAGTAWWNANEMALNIATGIGPVLRTGQDMYVLIWNDTGGTIPNGTVLRPYAVHLDGDVTMPTVEYAKADVFDTIEGSIMIATMDIPNGTKGLAIRFGRVRSIDTSGLTPGATAYIDPTTAGAITNTKPEFPNYDISIGTALVSDAVDGEFIFSVTRSYTDTFQHFWNGIFRESFAFKVASNGTVITGSLAPTNENVDMTMIFSDGFSTLDTDPSADIVLTAGDDDDPQMNYVYILQSDKTLTVSISGFPATEHIRVATVFLQTAATTEDEDALKNHNWNDHIQSPTNDMGHLAHIGQKLRKFEAQWDSGCELSAVLRTAPSPDELYVTVTGGVVFQFHPQTFPSFDTEVSGNLHVWNHYTTPYQTIQDIATQTADANGDPLTNKHFSVVIWGVASSAGEKSHLYLNLPTGSYNRASDALDDPDNYAVYTIPNEFAGTGFLIARLILQFSSGTTNITVTAVEDLRGKIPNTSAGGGSIGGAGATTYLALTDTDATFAAHGGKVLQVNGAENAVEFTNSITVDAIDEWTTDLGVTIETIELKDGGITLASGATVNEIETTLTNDVTHIATSAAIYAAIGSFGSDNEIPYTNAGGDDFDYSANLTFDGTSFTLGDTCDIRFGVSTTTIDRLDGAGIHFSMKHWGNIVMVIDSNGSDTNRYFAVMNNSNDVATATTIFKILETGATELYYNIVKRFETTANGIATNQIDELIPASGVIIDTGLLKDASLGNSSNYWNNGYIAQFLYFKDSSGTTASSIHADSSDNLYLKSAAGRVYLQDAGATRFETTVVGVKVTLPQTVQNYAVLCDVNGNITRTAVSSSPTTDFLRGDGSWSTPAGGASNPAGSDHAIQFNDASSFGGHADFQWIDNTHVMINQGTRDTGELLHIHNDTDYTYSMLIRGTSTYAHGLWIKHTGTSNSTYALAIQRNVPSSPEYLLGVLLDGRTFVRGYTGTYTFQIGQFYASGHGLEIDMAAYTSGAYYAINVYESTDTTAFTVTGAGDTYIRGDVDIGGTGAAKLYVYDNTISRHVAYFNQNHSSAHGIRVDIEASSGTTYTLFRGYRDTTKIAELRSNGKWWAADYQQSSDRRLKDVYQTVSDGLELTLKLNPVTYRWKDKRNDYIHVGFVAQEVQKIFPELVDGDSDGYLSLSYGKMSALAIAGLQGLYYEVKSIENQLRDEIFDLKIRVKELEDGKSS